MATFKTDYLKGRGREERFGRRIFLSEIRLWGTTGGDEEYYE
jgi:hypothetical protein